MYKAVVNQLGFCPDALQLFSRRWTKEKWACDLHVWILNGRVGLGGENKRAAFVPSSFLSLMYPWARSLILSSRSDCAFIWQPPGVNKCTCVMLLLDQKRNEGTVCEQGIFTNHSTSEVGPLGFPLACQMASTATRACVHLKLWVWNRCTWNCGG